MKLSAPLFGITFEGEFHPEVFNITGVSFTLPYKFSEPISVDIQATCFEGRINLVYDDKCVVCGDMAEAAIKAACHCLELLALAYKRNVCLAFEIHTLTASQ